MTVQVTAVTLDLSVPRRAGGFTAELSSRRNTVRSEVDTSIAVPGDKCTG